jgi:hypothetical protein
MVTLLAGIYDFHNFHIYKLLAAAVKLHYLILQYMPFFIAFKFMYTNENPFLRLPVYAQLLILNIIILMSSKNKIVQESVLSL